MIVPPRHRSRSQALYLAYVSGGLGHAAYNLLNALVPLQFKNVLSLASTRR